MLPSGVGPHVNVKVPRAYEAFPTFHTFVGFLSSVDAVVNDKVGGRGERLPADVTLEGLLCGVRPEVPGEE